MIRMLSVNHTIYRPAEIITRYWPILALSGPLGAKSVINFICKKM